MQNYATNCHLCTIAQLCRTISLQLRHVLRIWKKNLLNSNISSTSSHNMVIVGPQTADIGSGVWGTGANFNEFRILRSLLHRHRAVEVNQTLHYVWPSPGLVHYICILGGSCPQTEFCQVQNSLCVQVLRYRILAELLHALEQWASAKSTVVSSRNRAASHSTLGGRTV